MKFNDATFKAWIHKHINIDAISLYINVVKSYTIFLKDGRYIFVEDLSLIKQAVIRFYMKGKNSVDLS